MKFEIDTQRTVEYNYISISLTKNDISDLLKFGEIRQFTEGMEKFVKNNIIIKLVENNKINE
jgi:hypothetical protein